MRSRRLSTLFALLILSWTVISASSCSAVREFRSQRTASRATTAPTVQRTQVATLTPVPSPTASPTPSPTATPTYTPTALPTSTPQPPTAVSRAPGESPFALPEEGPFDIRLTQEDVAAALAGQVFSDQGWTIRDVQAVLTEEDVTAAFQATHAESGVTARIAFRGVPKIVSNQLYVRVLGFELDESVPALIRAIATAVVEELVKENSTADGLLVPLQGVALDDIQLSAGGIRIIGRVLAP
ncbi:MAG: hypothetical protein FJZ90_14005 [Chloroflexi bacterium]|nr:hypothetical protein [Chloroflexota bacterium]